jgi:hypothetical protein
MPVNLHQPPDKLLILARNFAIWEISFLRAIFLTDLSETTLLVYTVYEIWRGETIVCLLASELVMGGERDKNCCVRNLSRI